MGTPDYVVPVLESLCSAPSVQVTAVYTPPDRPRGRGRSVEETPVKTFAMQRELPVRQPPSLSPPAVQRELAEFEPDVIVVAAYGKLLPPQVLEIPPHGCLNLHPSLLPRLRGPSPVVTAIRDGEAATGVTLMLLNEGMDTGPIIAQQEVPMTGRETAGALTAALFQLGGELLLECLEPWLEGRIKPQHQDETRASVTRKLQRSDGEADWSTPALELERLRRAYDPWPGLFTVWEGKVLKLLDVVPLPGDGGPLGEPGRVVEVTSAETPIAVATGQGLLGLRTLQLEGRRAQSAADFLRGHPHFIEGQL
jgi:methionyl-tRNA formyltransferase